MNDAGSLFMQQIILLVNTIGILALVAGAWKLSSALTGLKHEDEKVTKALDGHLSLIEMVRARCDEAHALATEAKTETNYLRRDVTRIEETLKKD